MLFLCGIWVVRARLKPWREHLWLRLCSLDLTLRSGFALMWISHRRVSVPFYLRRKVGWKELLHMPAKVWRLCRRNSIPWRENVMRWSGVSCILGSICTEPILFWGLITSHSNGWRRCLMLMEGEDAGLICYRISVSRSCIDQVWSIRMWMH